MNVKNLILQTTNLPEVIAFIIEQYLKNNLKLGIELKFQQNILIYFREVDPTIIGGEPPYNKWSITLKNRINYANHLRELRLDQTEYFQRKIIDLLNTDNKIYVLQISNRIELYIQ